MFRAKNERGFDMTCTSHRARINAQKAAAKGKNLEIAVVIGAPILDKLAALKGFPPDVDDFEVLGSFYGKAAKLVKCETIDLMVPANAEVVLECELMATEGWVHDEAPFGEFTGMYGGGLKHNVEGHHSPQKRHLPVRDDRMRASLVHRQYAATAGDGG
jgi:2,5-furandicarboxylate decarboxylase 1